MVFGRGFWEGWTPNHECMPLFLEKNGVKIGGKTLFSFHSSIYAPKQQLCNIPMEKKSNIFLNSMLCLDCYPLASPICTILFQCWYLVTIIFSNNGFELIGKMFFFPLIPPIYPPK